MCHCGQTRCKKEIDIKWWTSREPRYTLFYLIIKCTIDTLGTISFNYKSSILDCERLKQRSMKSSDLLSSFFPHCLPFVFGYLSCVYVHDSIFYITFCSPSSSYILRKLAPAPVRRCSPELETAVIATMASPIQPHQQFLSHGSL